MAGPRFSRIRALIDALDDDARERLDRAIRDAVGADEDGDADEDEIEGIRQRIETLDEAALEALTVLAVVDPELVDRIAARDEIPAALADLGLVFPGADGEGLAVPLEVRIALLDDSTVTSAPLAVLLAVRDTADLEELAVLHDVATADATDHLDAAARIANALTESELLTNLFESLAPHCRRLLQWLCEADAPIPRELVAGRAARLAAIWHEPAGAAERVLTRLGLVHLIHVEGSEFLTLPPDLRMAVDPCIDAALVAEAHAAYAALRDDVVPTLRDVFPRGYGGSPLTCARLRTLRALTDAPDPDNLLDRILATFRVIGPEGGPGEFAPHLLDVRGPDAFARQCLRSWLGSVDDDFTRAMLAPFDCDTRAVADWIFSRMALQEAVPTEDPDDSMSAVQVWALFVYRFRAHLLLMLGVLTAGHWFHVVRASQWLVAVFRRLLWQYSGFAALGDDFPRHALPRDGADLSSDALAGLMEALVLVFIELLEPIGAVELDAGRTMFTVNPEALRVFRDGDPGFEELWMEAEGYVGEDIDLWLPAPTELGSRVHGIAAMAWRDDRVLVIEPDMHTHDLEELARWSRPEGDSGELRFVFDAASIARALDADEDPEEFLVWLATRSGRIPGPVRAFFPISASATDGTGLEDAAASYARRRVDALESWSEHPPLELVEAIRSWGTASVPELVRVGEACVDAGEWSRPELRHAIVLLGEIGDPQALPLVVRAIVESPAEPVESAAGAAAIRIGLEAFDGLGQILEQSHLDVDRRLTAVGALTALAGLHPTTSPAVVALLKRQLDPEGDPEFSTLLAVNIAETGHPDAEAILYQLRDEGGWLEEIMPFDEALWIASVSPAVWGHPQFAVPLASLFPAETESLRLQRAAGIDELLEGDVAAALLHRAPPRKNEGTEE